MDKQANEELLPCPWCNKPPIEITDSYIVGAVSCAYGHTNPMLSKEWNTRATPMVALDREDAEKHADNIWEQCASTSAIADYLQAKFGSPAARIPSIAEIALIIHEDNITGEDEIALFEERQAIKIRRLCEELNKGE